MLRCQELFNTELELITDVEIGEYIRKKAHIYFNAIYKVLKCVVWKQEYY